MRSFAVGFGLATRRAECSCFSSTGQYFSNVAHGNAYLARLHSNLESTSSIGITLTNDSTLPRNRRCKTEAMMSFVQDPSFHRPHRFRSSWLSRDQTGRKSEPRAISQRTQKICSSSHDTYLRRCPNRNEGTGAFASRTTATGFLGLLNPAIRQGLEWHSTRAQVHLIDALRAIINTDSGNVL